MTWYTAPLASLRTFGRRAPPAVSVGLPALISALWIATCAAAPELIWQGLKIIMSNPSWSALLSALLIAVVLVFFVEPILERMREYSEPSGHRQASDPRHRSPLFSAGVGIAFALTSICIHDAMSAFVSGKGAVGTSGLRASIELAASWAIVPFSVAIAWQGARHRWLAIPTGIVGAASSFVAGWLFDWTIQTVVATAVPCLLIQYLGHRRLAGMATPDFARCAAVVGGVALGWVIFASISDGLARGFNVRWLELYGHASLLVDVRFYIGWVIGLLLAPWPRGRPEHEH